MNTEIFKLPYQLFKNCRHEYLPLHGHQIKMLNTSMKYSNINTRLAICLTIFLLK